MDLEGKACNNCSRAIPKQARFCPFCGGVQLELTEAVVTGPPPMTPSSPPPPIRVLIAEDQAELRAALRSALEADREIAVVGEAENGLQAIEIFRELKPDVVSMNVGMPEMDGISATRTICSEGDGARVLIVSARSDVESVRAGTEAGASGWLTKPVTATEYVHAIKEASSKPPNKPTIPQEPEDDHPSASVSITPDDGFPLLLEVAVPEIYSRNSFRLLRLPVEVSPNKAKRAVERLAMEAGLKAKEVVDEKDGPTPPQPEAQTQTTILLPEVDPGAARAAFQRVGNPLDRLVDEFFWFWPHAPGAGKEDEALVAIAAGELDTAVEVWLERERRPAEHSIATHNLAVAYHLQALDLDLRGLDGSLSSEDEALRDKYWAEALARWPKVQTGTKFWNRLSDRIEALEDPRLSKKTSKQIRQTLPEALLLINARLAVRYGEANRMKEVGRHAHLIDGSGFSKTAHRKAKLAAVKTIRDRLTKACSNAEEEASKKPQQADTVAQDLLDNRALIFALQTIDNLFDPDDAFRQAFHDDLALQVRSAITTFANKTDDWNRVVLLTHCALDLAAGSRARSTISADLETAKANADTDLSWRLSGYWELPETTTRELERAKSLYGAGDFDAAVTLLESLWRSSSYLESRRIVGRPLSVALYARAGKRMERAFAGFNSKPAYLITNADRETIRNSVTSSGNDLRRALEVDPGNRSVHKEFDSLAGFADKAGIRMPGKPRGAKPGVAAPPPQRNAQPLAHAPSPASGTSTGAMTKEPPSPALAAAPSTGQRSAWWLIGVVGTVIAFIWVIVATGQPKPPIVYIDVTATHTATESSVSNWNGTHQPTWTSPPESVTPVRLEASVAPGLGRANLRSGPGKNYAVLVSLESGTRVVVLGSAPDSVWLYVDAPAAGMQGWMSVGVLSTTGDVASVPTLEFSSPTVRPTATRTPTLTRRPTSRPTRTPTRRPTATRRPTSTPAPILNVPVLLVNKANVSFTAQYSGPVNRTVTVGAFDSATVYLAAGTYHYIITASGFETLTGTDNFVAGYRYTRTWSRAP